ncbi:MAG: TMF family protein [Alphaproteobacteria bacterium]|nr:TMF family protein [Alphaproteobacteria bacterium]
MRNYLLTSAAALMIMGSSAYAAEPMNMEQMQSQLEALSQQVEKLSAVVEQQNRLIMSQKSKIEMHDTTIAEQEQKVSEQSMKIGEIAAIAPAAGGTPDKDAVKISMKPGPKFESADGQYSFQPTGRMHLDFTHFEDDKRDNPDGANLRRARLGAKGDIGEDLNYKIELDFGGESTNLKDAYLAYTGLGFADIVLGNAKPPMGMEQATSSNYITMIERSPVTNAFTRGEILGGALKGGGENWSLAGGVYNEDAGVNTSDDEGVSAEMRGSVDLLPGDNVLHVGLGGSLRTPNATSESVSLGGKPAGTGSNLISTGTIANVDSSRVLGVELAGAFGPFSVQGEYMNYAIDRDSGSDPEFDGWYAQASYLLTGESRPYKGSTGTFGRVKPARPFSLKNGTPGAWEVAARVDQLDLNDAGAGVAGGKMTDWTLGVNWYMTDNVRMMLDYVSVDTDDNAVIANDDPAVVTLRTQWDF